MIFIKSILKKDLDSMLCDDIHEYFNPHYNELQKGVS